MPQAGGGPQDGGRSARGRPPAGAAGPVRSARAVLARQTTTVLAITTAWLVAIVALWALRRVLAWTVIAGFFAIVLSPFADRLHRRLHIRRGVAVAMVMVGALGTVLGVVAAFVVPVARHAPELANDLPNLVDQAAQGRGRVGTAVARLHLDTWVRDHRETVDAQVSKLGSGSLRMAPYLFSGVLSAVTVLVLTIFFLLHGPALCRGIDELLPFRHRDQVRRLAADAAQAMSGYMVGNFAISLIAGSAAFAMLSALRVPYAIVLAAWVAFADLIPLVGATMGAIPAVFLALLHSTTAGIVAVAFFVVYQQFENSVVQVAVMRRTVKVNSLTVILSVLAGVELFGILGAFLAIPAAGVVQLVAREASAYRAQRRLV